MNESGHKTVSIVVAILMLVVGLGVGYGIGHGKDSNSMNMSSSHMESSSKAASLQSNLVTLGVEHMMLTNSAVDGALDGSPNATATATALYANGNNIGAAIGSIYGKDAENTFNSVWKLHLDEFVKYAVASKSGDEAGKSAALSDIDSKYTKPLAQYLAKANPNLPEDTLESALREHVDMTAKMIDFHVAANYTEESNELTMANKHMEGIMSTLAEGIVKQYPDKF